MKDQATIIHKIKTFLSSNNLSMNFKFINMFLQSLCNPFFKAFPLVNNLETQLKNITFPTTLR